MNKNRAKEEGSHKAAGRLLQESPAENILVFLVLAIIILAVALFSRQQRFPQHSTPPIQPDSAENYVWLTGSPVIPDGLYLLTPEQLESNFPGTVSLLPEGSAQAKSSLVYAIQYDANKPRAVSLPPRVANIFFLSIPINRADIDILTSLPGIGPVLAERIVQQREQNAPFRSKDELLQIAGIGPKKFAGLVVDRITLE